MENESSIFIPFSDPVAGSIGAGKFEIQFFQRVELGKKLLQDSRLPIQAATDLSEAAKLVVAAAKKV